jgi:murein DD-endopeptidase MepM/ murein hydrolase activator NlpD
LQNFGSTFQKQELRLAIGQSQAIASAALLGVTFSVGLIAGLVPAQPAGAVVDSVKPEVSGAASGSLRLVGPTSAEAYVGKGVTLTNGANSAARLVVALAPTSLLHPLSAEDALSLTTTLETGGFPGELSEGQTASQTTASSDSSASTQTPVSIVQLPLLASSLDASELVQSLSSSLQVSPALADSAAPAAVEIEHDFANVSLVGAVPQPLADSPLEAATPEVVDVDAVDAALTAAAAPQTAPEGLEVEALPIADAPIDQTQPTAQAPAETAQDLMGEVKRQIVAQSINQSSSKTSPNPLISSSQFLPQIARRGIFPQLPNLDLPPLSPAERYLPGSGGMTTGFIWPAKGVFTSGYGPRWGRMHRGIDIAAPIGTAIVAAAAGTVVTSEWNSGGFGNLVKIRHPDGSLTLYAHNNRLIARVGEYVQQGQLISEMGSTGRSTGPHVHFEIHPPGMGAVNPMHYLSRG